MRKLNRPHDLVSGQTHMSWRECERAWAWFSCQPIAAPTNKGINQDGVTHGFPHDSKFNIPLSLSLGIMPLLNLVVVNIAGWFIQLNACLHDAIIKYMPYVPIYHR